MDDKKVKRLIKKIKRGNQAVFQEVYDMYADYALRSCFYITQNSNHTADIVQETFIKVYQGLQTFDMKRPFKPWFYQILLNESKRYMKKQNKQAIPVESEQMLDYLNEQEMSPEITTHIMEDLTEISEDHRVVLILKYLEGFTEKEIAILLNLNINTVKSRLFKARGKMRKIIGGVKNER